MHNLSAKEIHKLFLSKKVSAKEIITHFLNRIEVYDKSIGSFLMVFKDRAIKKAEALDEKLKQGHPVGKLAGIPVSIKDNIQIKGEKTTCASKFLDNYVADFDSTVVKLLEDEDAIIIGKTNLDEFAMGSTNEFSCYYPVKNPWNEDCVAGGSSGGSAASVSARLCLASLGSDTGGSVRLPASFCGITGFKPSYGGISRYGLVAFGSSFDQVGVFVSSVSDLSMFLDVLNKKDPLDSTSIDLKEVSKEKPKKKNIGIPRKLVLGMKDEYKSIFLNNLEKLKRLGYNLVDVDLDDVLDSSVALYYSSAITEATTNLFRFDGIRYGKRVDSETVDQTYVSSRSEGFGVEVKRRICLGTYLLVYGSRKGLDVVSQKIRIKIKKQFKSVFENVDFVCMPVSTGSASKFNGFSDATQAYLQDIFTIGPNVAQLPAISVHSDFDSQNNPVGLQLIGDKFDDCDLISLAEKFDESFCFDLKKVPNKFL